MNRLFFGDNLGWLRDPKEFPDASVDLVYLDPPFNSNADYKVLFREASGEASPAQFHAFTDTWSWADALKQAAKKNPAVARQDQRKGWRPTLTRTHFTRRARSRNAQLHRTADGPKAELRRAKKLKTLRRSANACPYFF